MTRYATLIVVIATIFTGFALHAHARFDSPQILAQGRDPFPTNSNPQPVQPQPEPQQPAPDEPVVTSTTTNSSVPVEQYEDPKEKGEVNTDLFFVTSISVEQKPVDQGVATKSVVFKGLAAPNSQVTLFIYSTPIIVTVTADDEGVWSYTLERELENGRHTMYVAQVNNSGKIVAKTNPIFFTQTEAQIEVEPSESVLITPPRKSFIDSYFLLTVSGIFVFALIITVTIVGLSSKRSI
jgi:hypothetical protein